MVQFIYRYISQNVWIELNIHRVDQSILLKTISL